MRVVPVTPPTDPARDRKRGHRAVAAGASAEIPTGGLTGKGLGLGHNAAINANPVNVEVIAGDEHYCMRFGGTIKFRINSYFSASNAPSSPSCPASSRRGAPVAYPRVATGSLIVRRTRRAPEAAL